MGLGMEQGDTDGPGRALRIQQAHDLGSERKLQEALGYAREENAKQHAELCGLRKLRDEQSAALDRVMRENTLLSQHLDDLRTLIRAMRRNDE